MLDAPAIIAPVLMDKRETAAALRISVPTLDRLTEPRGPIPCVRLGQRVLYRRAALESWAAQQEQQAQETKL